MSIRKFNVNKTESSIALASVAFPGFMSPEDKLALDTLVAANFQGGSITSVTVEMKDVTEVKDRLTALESSVSNIQSTVSTLKSKLDLYPAMHSSDNNTYAIKNGAWEIVCGSDEAVLVYTQPSAVSLAIQSLESGKLEIDETTKPEIVEEMRELLGEELFNELSANNFSTLELKPQIPEKEQLKQAIENYYKQKEINLQYTEEFSNDKLSEQK